MDFKKRKEKYNNLLSVSLPFRCTVILESKEQAPIQPSPGSFTLGYFYWEFILSPTSLDKSSDWARWPVPYLDQHIVWLQDGGTFPWGPEEWRQVKFYKVDFYTFSESWVAIGSDLILLETLSSVLLAGELSVSRAERTNSVSSRQAFMWCIEIIPMTVTEEAALHFLKYLVQN